jgi:cardiolipin synthase (CMP-forming)
MTLANKITIIRIVLIPVFIIMLLQGQLAIAAAIFTATILTDALDGFIARWKKQKTALGAFLDPMADKLLLFSTFLTFAYLRIIPRWVFVIIFSRDLLIVLGWLIIYFITDSTEIKPRFMGKITTIFQMGTLWFYLINVPLYITEKLLIVTIAITTISALDYVIAGSTSLNRHA